MYVGHKPEELSNYYFVVVLVDEGIVQGVFEWDDFETAKKKAVGFAATCIRQQKESDSYAQIWKRESKYSTARLLETLPEH